MLSSTWIYILVAIGVLIIIAVAVVLALFVDTSSSPTPVTPIIPTVTAISPTPTVTVTVTPTVTPRPPPTLQDFLYVACINSVVLYDVRPAGVPITPTTVIPLTGGLENTSQSYMALSDDYKSMWILCSTGLVPIDLTTSPPTIPSTVAIAMTAPTGFVAFGGRGFVIDGPDFKVVDLTTQTLLDTLPFASGVGKSIVLSPDGATAYVCTVSVGITTIRVVENIQTTASFGATSVPNASITNPLSMTITPDGKTLYIANSDPVTGDVYPVDVSVPTPVVGTAISVTPVMAGLLDIEVAPDGSILTLGQGPGPTSLLSRIIGTTPQPNINTLGLGAWDLTIKTDVTPNIGYIVNSIALEVRPLDLSTYVVGASAFVGGTPTNPYRAALGPVPGSV